MTVLRTLLGRLGLLDGTRTDGFVRAWITELGIKTPSADCPVKQLSGGNQQRVVLSKWMERSPRILILDGPTVGIDVKAKGEIHEIMRTLADSGMGILMISDEAAEIVQHTQPDPAHEGRADHRRARDPRGHRGGPPEGAAGHMSDATRQRRAGAWRSLRRPRSPEPRELPLHPDHRLLPDREQHQLLLPVRWRTSSTC